MSPIGMWQNWKFQSSVIFWGIHTKHDHRKTLFDGRRLKKNPFNFKYKCIYILDWILGGEIKPSKIDFFPNEIFVIV